MVKNIMKRDGRLANFDISKIENAISKAMNAVGDREFKTVHKLALLKKRLIRSLNKAKHLLLKKFKTLLSACL